MARASDWGNKGIPFSNKQECTKCSKNRYSVGTNYKDEEQKMC
jgi:hypothetical protein